VRKTRVRGEARTLAHGCFRLHETEYVCGAGCLHPAGKRVAVWSTDLPLLPGSSTGYDVMAFVGRKRHVEYRQREEIRAELADEYGIVLSTGEISRLGRLFLSYFERLHCRRRSKIREALAAAGGWALHLDSTGEDGRGTLLVLYAGRRRWVLESAKIPTECSETVLPWVERVAGWAGVPRAVVRDLSHAMTKACEAFRKAHDGQVRVLSCHYHFLSDVGKDLLDATHGKLRDLFRNCKVRPKLRALVRDLGRKLGCKVGAVREGVVEWQNREEPGHHLPEGLEGVGVVRAVAQWVLDYSVESTGQDFPFVLPYLDLFDRCRSARRAIDAFLRHPPADRVVLRELERLQRILNRLRGAPPFHTTTKMLRRRAVLFRELRDALRLTGKPTPDDPSQEEVQGVEKAIAELTESLQQRRPSRGAAEDQRKAIDIVRHHLACHGETLRGHVIPLSDGSDLVVERTNDCIEGLFHSLKHDERRRSGRKILTQDFESLPAAAALARNLKCPDYVEILCGSIEELPRAFHALDEEDKRRRLAGEDPLDDPEPGTSDLTKTPTASLPIEDRRVIRTEAMSKRILKAARSRAPRKTTPAAAAG
jgi:hypothetical protein